MESSKRSSRLVSTLLVHLLLVCDISISSPKPLLRCHQDELSALLQFKDSFVFANQSCLEESNRGALYRPKVESWNLETRDCCEWNGVECDTETNHVISLDLALSCLVGSINSSSSLFRLVHLQSLDLADNNFSYTQIPPEIGNLSNLTLLILSSSFFTGQIPSSIGNLTKLVRLYMEGNKLFGQIPFTLWNLTSLQVVSLSNNQFSGEIPVQISHLASLQFLDLSSNNLEGSVPSSFSNLKNLERLYLNSNNLSGFVDFNIFFQLKNLSHLDLSLNKLSLLTRVNKSPTKFSILGLASCNLTEFPSFLREQHQLVSLDLSSNEINGEIPSWMCNLSANSLDYLNLSNNHLTGFEHDALLWKKLRILDLRSNMLQGPLPVAPPSTMKYLISNNMMSGPVSLSFCNLTSLEALDLSFNNLSGNLPQCLSISSDSLSLLDLRRNNFDGFIPSVWREGCKLRMISLSYNLLRGQIPKSLVNCSSLQLIDFSNNRLNDGFPSWTASLVELQILLLKSNQFHGAINQVESFAFQNLRIIDLSYNNFCGELQSFYFQNWDAMKDINENHHMAYISESLFPPSYYYGEYFGDYHFSMVMYVKGLETNYSKIPDILTAIDFSNNKFEGNIPEIIGNLQALYFLNLSSNNLQGNIPSSLSNLRKLESLDLSNNKLSGEIPWQLTKISSLSSLDVSFNNLSGRIPQGQQFCTFDDTSFEGNPRLFSDTSGNQCGNRRTNMPAPTSPSSMQDEDSSDSRFEWNWMIILLGYGSGLVVGVVAGNEFVIRKQKWFLKILGKKKADQ